MEHKYFGGSERPVQSDDLSIAKAIEDALRPLAEAVGLDQAALAQAVERDISRRVARAAFDHLVHEGIRLESARVLDLGAGLGHASVEAVVRGCDLVAIEPGFEWCTVVRRRLNGAGGGIAVVGDGEQLPFADDSFDLIVSIGVLEHVRRPKVFLAEAYRVLRPGGAMFLSCENYLSFWEPHYQLAWLPLFPKPLASRYLRLRGRSDEFLLSSITYTTRPGVHRWLRRIGFQFQREINLRRKLSAAPTKVTDECEPPNRRWSAKSAIARFIFELENLRVLVKPYLATLVRKAPSKPEMTEL